MRFCGLRGDRNVGAVARSAERNRKPDAAAGAGMNSVLPFSVVIA